MAIELLDTIIIRDRSLNQVVITISTVALTALGAWVLTKRGESRTKRARLRAIEHELRENRLAVDGLLVGQSPAIGISREIWDRLRVDLALDLPDAAYEKVVAGYYGFSESRARFERALGGKASNADKQWLAQWQGLLFDAHLQVTGELHLRWKWKAQVAMVWERRTKLLRRSEAAQPGAEQ